MMCAEASWDDRWADVRDRWADVRGGKVGGKGVGMSSAHPSPSARLLELGAAVEVCWTGADEVRLVLVDEDVVTHAAVRRQVAGRARDAVAAGERAAAAVARPLLRSGQQVGEPGERQRG